MMSVLVLAAAVGVYSLFSSSSFSLALHCLGFILLSVLYKKEKKSHVHYPIHATLWCPSGICCRAEPLHHNCSAAIYELETSVYVTAMTVYFSINQNASDLSCNTFCFTKLQCMIICRFMVIIYGLLLSYITDPKSPHVVVHVDTISSNTGQKLNHPYQSDMLQFSNYFGKISLRFTFFFNWLAILDKPDSKKALFISCSACYTGLTCSHVLYVFFARWVAVSVQTKSSPALWVQWSSVLLCNAATVTSAASLDVSVESEILTDGWCWCLCLCVHFWEWG